MLMSEKAPPSFGDTRILVFGGAAAVALVAIAVTSRDKRGHRNPVD